MSYLFIVGLREEACCYLASVFIATQTLKVGVIFHRPYKRIRPLLPLLFRDTMSAVQIHPNSFPDSPQSTPAQNASLHN